MKREGRQQGMVRTLRILPNTLNPRPDTRFVNRFESPPHLGCSPGSRPCPPTTKFTGKCRQPRCNGCHLHPTCKAKDKTKGNQKMKSTDVVSNHKLLDFRVVDAPPGMKLYGVSATRILDQLSSYHANDDGDDEVSDCDGDDDQDGPYGARDGQTTVEIVNDASDDKNQNGDDDEKMSSYDVGFMLDQVKGDDVWFLVREIRFFPYPPLTLI